MLTTRHYIVACLLLLLTAAGGHAAAAPADEFALVTTKAGEIQFGLVVGETDDLITLRSLKTLKDTVFGKHDLLSSKRNLDESDAFVQEEFPYVLAWRLGKSTVTNPDGSARQGRLVIVPFAVDSGVPADGLSAFQTNLATIIAQRKIEVVDAGQVQKALTDLSVQDPLTPPVLPLGKTLKSDWVLTGKVLSQDKVRTLHYRLIDVQSERTLVAGAKPLLAAGPTPTTAPTPEKKVVLAPAKPVDLAGTWQIPSTRGSTTITVISLGNDQYILQTSSIYGGEYQWKGNALTMTRPAYKTYAANASEMMVWRLRTDGTLILTNTRWGGHAMIREDPDKKQPESAKAPGTSPPAR